MSLHRKPLLFVVFLLLLSVVASAAPKAPQPLPTLESKYPELSSGPLSRAVVDDLPTGVVLMTAGMKIKVSDIAKELAQGDPSVAAMFSTHEFVILEQMAVRKLLASEAAAWAAKRNVPGDPDKQLQAYLESVTSGITVSGDEVAKYCKDNPILVAGATFDQVRPKVTEILIKQKSDAAVDKYVRSIGGRHVIRIADGWVSKQYKQWMENPVEDARRAGKPAIVQFISADSPECLAMMPILGGLQQTHQDKVSIVTIPIEADPVLGIRYEAVNTPTQLFYDKSGKLFFRHVGFYDEAGLKAKLKEMGVE